MLKPSSTAYAHAAKMAIENLGSTCWAGSKNLGIDKTDPNQLTEEERKSLYA
jgi:hypothetical protein